MYKTKDDERLCVITELGLALHHLEHAKAALKKGDPKGVDHHMEEAADDIECVMDYIKGHHHGRESALEAIREFLPELRDILPELVEKKVEHKMDNPRPYRGYR